MGKKTRDWFEPFMEPGETLQSSVPAQGGVHPFTLLFPGIGAVVAAVVTANQPVVQIVLMSVAFTLIGASLTTARYRVVGITNRAVLLCGARPFRPAKPTKLLERLSHGDQFAPNGSFWGQVQVGNERLWVHRRFFDTLASVEMAAGPVASSAARANRAKKKVKHVRRRR